MKKLETSVIRSIEKLTLPWPTYFSLDMANTGQKFPNGFLLLKSTLFHLKTAKFLEFLKNIDQGGCNRVAKFGQKCPVLAVEIAKNKTSR